MAGDYNEPQPGQEVGPFVAQLSMWQDILQMVNDYKAGNLSLPRRTSGQRVQPQLENEGESTDIDAGSPLYLDQLQQMIGTPVESELESLTATNPLFSRATPNFDLIGDARISPRQIPDTFSGPVYGPRFQAVRLDAVRDPADKWISIDATDPTKWTTSTSGLYRIVGLYTEQKLAIVDTQQSQQIWEFRKNEGNFDVYHLDSGLYKASVTNFVEAGGNAGDRGLCVQIGNSFYSIPGGAFSCDSLCECDVFLLAVGEEACGVCAGLMPVGTGGGPGNSWQWDRAGTLESWQVRDDGSTPISLGGGVYRQPGTYQRFSSGVPGPVFPVTITYAARTTPNDEGWTATAVRDDDSKILQIMETEDCSGNPARSFVVYEDYPNDPWTPTSPDSWTGFVRTAQAAMSSGSMGAMLTSLEKELGYQFIGSKCGLRDAQKLRASGASNEAVAKQVMRSKPRGITMKMLLERLDEI